MPSSMGPEIRYKPAAVDPNPPEATRSACTTGPLVSKLSSSHQRALNCASYSIVALDKFVGTRYVRFPSGENSNSSSSVPSVFASMVRVFMVVSPDAQVLPPRHRVAIRIAKRTTTRFAFMVFSL